jgi:hypothetical protein
VKRKKLVAHQRRKHRYTGPYYPPYSVTFRDVTPVISVMTAEPWSI